DEAGIRLAEARVVPDTEAEIVEAVNAMRAKHDYVFTTGGIGPTHDDITAESVAKAFGRKLIRHPEAYRRLVAQFEARGMEINAARLRMTNTPEGANLVENGISVAPGFQVENVYVMAGVPQVAHAMIDWLAPRLEGGKPVQTKTLVCSLGEGNLASGLSDIQDRYAEIDIGSYPFYETGNYGTSIVLRHTDEALLEKAGAEVADLMRSLGGEPRDKI
ncbi:MAG: molybdopterin-binding protein, partial [Pseudomonadota bacterium]|nr:molybdopterin-binding protein [Pseudomonadota bacterium]